MFFNDFIGYQFVQNAYLAGAFIAMPCAMLGLILVLRKLSLIGDGLSHVSFGAIALGLFMGLWPLYVAIPIVIIAAYFIWQLSEKTKLYGDAAIGIVSAVGIAGGVILASLSKGFNIDLFSYLFGNILAISRQEIYLSIGLSILVSLIIIWFYQDLFATTFDEDYAKASGIKTKRLNFILMTLTGITVVLAIKVVGIMLVSALLIIPASAALQISKSFKRAMISSIAVALLAVLIGISASLYLDWPAGATIIITSFIIFIGLFLISRLKK